MTTAWEEIERVRSLPLADEDGNPIELAAAPPLSGAEIEEVERRSGAALPRELVELLRRCGGLDGVLDAVDFSGRSINSFAFEEVFPHAHPIAQDGYGNFWVLDITGETAEVAPVFFACHDAPVVLYQSPDLAHFVREVIRMNLAPHRSLVDDVHEDRPFDVWRKNPGTISRAAALGSADPELRAFATTLDDRFTLVDLRSPEIGMGLSWGRHGPNTVVRRHGDQRIFAYAPPQPRSLWSRLTGR
jgi:hypothetical protein